MWCEIISIRLYHEQNGGTNENVLRDFGYLFGRRISNCLDRTGKGRGAFVNHARRLKHSHDSIVGACLFWGSAILFTAWLVTHILRSPSPALENLQNIKDYIYAALNGEAK